MEYEVRNSTAWNVEGGQINIANDNAAIYATQNNQFMPDELENITKNIMSHIDQLDKENKGIIEDIVDMIKEEFARPEPKINRLRSCVTLIAPMIAAANGIPVLAENLRKLLDYVTPYIR